ncbi:hypothetical protein GCM10010123_06990 [Pilimelia anulata]|uniref:Uncharacterized protein n=1 Tax=Pilimelia anulata TaxID=53371 RepID=A0A8J3B072_9ACTN|nr:hypothetical protein [Pilimelia anulata]GGJ79795.1 hypothetical protein GCM10010123_06990 [Pilimelia anulata]
MHQPAFITRASEAEDLTDWIFIQPSPIALKAPQIVYGEIQSLSESPEIGMEGVPFTEAGTGHHNRPRTLAESRTFSINLQDHRDATLAELLHEFRQAQARI